MHLNSLRDPTGRDDAVDSVVADGGGVVAAAAADEIDGIAAYGLLGGFHATELYRYLVSGDDVWVCGLDGDEKGEVRTPQVGMFLATAMH